MVMEIGLFALIVVALGAAAVGCALGWTAGRFAMRPMQVRLQSELEKERSVHAERLKAYADADVRLRETFQALSAEALKSNNDAFLDLAETRLREARSEAAADMEQRKKAIEELLAPVSLTLEKVDEEIREAERRRLHEGGQLLQQIASLDAAGRELR